MTTSESVPTNGKHPFGAGPSNKAAPVDNAVTLEDVSISFGDHYAVRGVTFGLPAGQVTALVGPSGCGKTSVLRAINRLHDHTGGKVTGTVRLGEVDVYGPSIDPEKLRGRIGMVFQRPNPFPTMSIFDNAVSGLRLSGVRNKQHLREAAEAALHQAALWDIVKDRLKQPAVRLSGGQQQRLCIARALAVEPLVLLMDEPCLRPRSGGHGQDRGPDNQPVRRRDRGPGHPQYVPSVAGIRPRRRLSPRRRPHR